MEITESSLVTKHNVVKSRIDEFKNAGFSIAIDDFGTGMSSLNRIKDITIDAIKLDREFLNGIFNSDKGISIIKGILLIATELNALTIAEGIETQEQLMLLQNMSCDVGQGYYFSKPIPKEDFQKLLNNQYSLNKNGTVISQ